MFTTNFDFTKNNPFFSAFEKHQADSMKFFEEHFAPVAEVFGKQKEFATKVQETFKPIADFNKEVFNTHTEIQKQVAQEFTNQLKTGFELSKSVTEDYSALVKETFSFPNVDAKKTASTARKTTSAAK